MITAFVCLVSACIILYKVIGAAAQMQVYEFRGHPARCLAVIASWVMLGTGAVAVVLGLQQWVVVLLAGIALMLLIERRAIR